MVHESSTSRTDSRAAQHALPFIFAVYVAGLLLANATGAKVMSIGPLVLSVGALAYPLTFVLQDVINELFGKQYAKKLVMATALALVFLVGFTVVSTPIEDAFRPEMTRAYELVLGSAPRIVFASMVAFFVGGLIDVNVFFWARERWPESLLTRKTTSTAVSQLVDSLLFVCIGFAGAMPMGALIAMGLSQYAVKQVMAVGGLPVTYFLIHRLR